MSGETTRAPLAGWTLPLARAAAAAFREADGRHATMPPCYLAGEGAYISPA